MSSGSTLDTAVVILASVFGTGGIAATIKVIVDWRAGNRAHEVEAGEVRVKRLESHIERLESRIKALEQAQDRLERERTQDRNYISLLQLDLARNQIDIPPRPGQS